MLRAGNSTNSASVASPTVPATEIAGGVPLHKRSKLDLSAAAVIVQMAGGDAPAKKSISPVPAGTSSTNPVTAPHPSDLRSSTTAAGPVPTTENGSIVMKQLPRKRVRLANQEARIARRREQNRINAANCKKRKFERIALLTTEHGRLKSEGEKLKKVLADLETELRAVYAKIRR